MKVKKMNNQNKEPKLDESDYQSFDIDSHKAYLLYKWENRLVIGLTIVLILNIFFLIKNAMEFFD